MATEEVQLAWRLSIAGAEDVKARLSELHEQFNLGEISAEDYGKGLNKVSSTARALGSQSQLNTRIFLAQHPTINQLTRTMSGFNRVLSATVAAQNAVNIASLLSVTRSGELTTLQNELAAAERDYNNALDPETKEEAARNVAEIKSTIEETKKSMDEDFINKIFSFGTAIASIGTTVILAAPQISAIFAGLSAGAIAAGAAIAAPFVAAAAAIYMIMTPGDQVAEFFKMLFPSMSKEIDQFSADVDKVFSKDIPAFFMSIGPALQTLDTTLVMAWGVMGAEMSVIWNRISQAFGMFWNGLVDFAHNASNSIISVVNGMVNGIISAVRSALDWLAKLPGNIASGASSLLSGSANAIGGAVGMKVAKAAAGMDEVVTGPKLILVGEGGQREHVKVTPGSRGSADGTTIINNHYRIEGSLYAERDLENLTNRHMKHQFRRRNFSK